VTGRASSPRTYACDLFPKVLFWNKWRTKLWELANEGSAGKQPLIRMCSPGLPRLAGQLSRGLGLIFYTLPHAHQQHRNIEGTAGTRYVTFFKLKYLAIFRGKQRDKQRKILI